MTEEMPVEEQAEFIMVAFREYLEEEPEDLEGLSRFMCHCGMDLMVAPNDTRTLEDFVLDHYRRSDGGYDVNRFLVDFDTQPEIQARIAFLKAEHEAKQGHRRQQQRESKRRRRRQHGRQVATG